VLRKRSWRNAVLGAGAALAAWSAAAQQGGRVATTADALTTSPVFYQGKHVAVRRETVENAGVTELARTAKPVAIYWREQPSGSPDVEIRGEFWDLGRLQKDDARLAGVDVGPLLRATTNGEWPGRDHVFVILGASTADSPFAAPASLIRLSVGIESVDDLIADLETALVRSAAAAGA